MENERDNLKTQIEDKDLEIAELQNLLFRPGTSNSNNVEEEEEERDSLNLKLSEKDQMLLNAQEREDQFIANAKMDQDNWIEERDTMLSQISKLAVQADKMSALEN